MPGVAKPVGRLRTVNDNVCKASGILRFFERDGLNHGFRLLAQFIGELRSYDVSHAFSPIYVINPNRPMT